jgi:LPXTG-motif cell wall-anchored protein
VSAPIEPKAAPVAGGGLPFTGADISEMAAVGAGALVAGGLMVRRSRRLRQVAA